MNPSARTVDFDAEPTLVDNYDRMPRLFIPAYDASHVMAAALLRDAIGTSGTILLIGAGGGAELVCFIDTSPDWRFVATDPSSAMLDRACDKVAAKNALDRVAFHTTDARSAPPGPFDAATAFLALHFVSDDGARLDTYRAVHERLTPGAPFLLINGTSTPQTFDVDLQRYIAHARLMGAEQHWLDEALAMLRTSVHFLAPEREVALLGEAGFGRVEPFYQGLWFRGWMARA